MSLSVVIAAGGTGGHLIPALAIADALTEADPSIRIAFVGTARSLDTELVQRYPAHRTAVRPFTRDARGVLAPLSLVPATVQARRILSRARASVVVGMGGYASMPVVAAAAIARIPSVVHEANAIPGLANELAARVTPNIAVSFPEAARAFGRRTPRVIGMPLRPAIATFDRDAARAEAARELGLDQARPTLLVFGGSQGARRINEATLGYAAKTPDAQIVLIAGRAHAEALAARAPASVRVLPFLQRMELAYAIADVAVCRSGASTIAELAATGLPAILVPYPHARRGEQDANARSHARAGGAIVVEDARLTPEVFRDTVGSLLGDGERLRAMATSARAAARPRAAHDMAAWIAELARG